MDVDLKAATWLPWAAKRISAAAAPFGISVALVIESSAPLRLGHPPANQQYTVSAFLLILIARISLSALCSVRRRAQCDECGTRAPRREYGEEGRGSDPAFEPRGADLGRR